MIQIAPSLLSCDFSHLEQEIRTVEKAGCDLLHLDIMDGHFVPNITFGPVVIKGIRKLTDLPLDVHLMIDTPEKWIEEFVTAGADWLSFHIEATKDIRKVIKLIKKNKKLTGIAVNPETPIEEVIPWIRELDFVVIMTVNPGFGGQGFIREPLKKVEILNQRGIRVEVDGGVKLDNLKQVLEALEVPCPKGQGRGWRGRCPRQGAHTIVSGSGIFKTDNPGATVKKFKEIIKTYAPTYRG